MDTITFNGERVHITAGPATSFGLTFAPTVRRLPRLALTRQHGHWAARITGQNDSYLECEGTTRTKAITHALRLWRTQRWPIITRQA